MGYVFIILIAFWLVTYVVLLTRVEPDSRARSIIGSILGKTIISDKFHMHIKSSASDNDAWHFWPITTYNFVWRVENEGFLFNLFILLIQVVYEILLFIMPIGVIVVIFVYFSK